MQVTVEWPKKGMNMNTWQEAVMLAGGMLCGWLLYKWWK